MGEFQMLTKRIFAFIMGLTVAFCLQCLAPNSTEAADVWAYTDSTGEYYVRTETIKDKEIKEIDRVKQWFQVNVKQVKNGRLLHDNVWSFMQTKSGNWGYNPYPLMKMDARAEAIFRVAQQYR